MNPESSKQFGLRKFSELDDLSIADRDPDIRGWDVISAEGQSIGEVDDLIVDVSAMKVRYLEVDLDTDVLKLDNDRHVLVPVEAAQLDRDGRRVVLSNLSSRAIAQLPAYGDDFEADYDRRFTASERLTGAERSTSETGSRLTRAEEELRIGTRAVAAGEVVVGKHVETEHVSESVTRKRERVKIERRPVDAATATDADLREDEIRVPVMQEEIVVEKRPVVKEELVISKEVIEEPQTIEADLRREEFDVKRTDEQVVDPASRGTSKSRGDR